MVNLLRRTELQIIYDFLLNEEYREEWLPLDTLERDNFESEKYSELENLLKESGFEIEWHKSRTTMPYRGTLYFVSFSEETDKCRLELKQYLFDNQDHTARLVITFYNPKNISHTYENMEKLLTTTAEALKEMNIIVSTE